jgi:hypothetical protein
MLKDYCLERAPSGVAEKALALKGRDFSPAVNTIISKGFSP